MARNSEKAVPMNFQSIQQIDVPKGRDGKHKGIVTQILSDIHQLRSGAALKTSPRRWARNGATRPAPGPRRWAARAMREP